MNVAPTETYNLLINPFYSFLKIKKADILKNDLDLNSKFNLTLILWLQNQRVVYCPMAIYGISTRHIKKINRYCMFKGVKA